MTRGIRRDLRRAMDAVSEEISATRSSGGKYTSGLASEGYSGGYRDALSDVQLALNGVPPSGSRFWPSATEEERK